MPGQERGRRSWLRGPPADGETVWLISWGYVWLLRFWVGEDGNRDAGSASNGTKINPVRDEPQARSALDCGSPAAAVAERQPAASGGPSAAGLRDESGSRLPQSMAPGRATRNASPPS